MKRSNLQRALRALRLSLSLLGPALAHAAPVAELRGYIVGGAAFSPGFYYSQSVSPATALSRRGAPQTRASSVFIDHIKPWETSPVGFTAYTLTLAFNGTHSLTDPFGLRPGFTALGSVGYDIRDERNGDVFAHGLFDSSDSVPGTTLVRNIVIPADEATDYLSIDISRDT